ncbi:transglutaminase domain-containing protein [Risungbinella massiliensis]|uniref:transglutaminase domain-containing protein n=1 Tax=Risungbinella massiliensis TaxID=1329796 RepID=UPI0005CBF3E8|nr:transglutaminase-like domain-containing protein [Risungbinella massiliensis]
MKMDPKWLLISFLTMSFATFYTEELPAFNHEVSQQNIYLFPYAKKIGTSIQYTQAVNQVQIEMELSRYPKKEGIIWIKVSQQDRDESIQRFFTVQGGRFSQAIDLPFGEGLYEIEVFASNSTTSYYPLAKWTISHSGKRGLPIQTGLTAIREGLSWEVPTMNQMNESTFPIKIKVANPTLSSILLQVQKGSQIAKRLLYLKGGSLELEVPYLFGAGTYQIQLLAPTEADSTRYEEMIRFSPQTTADFVANPIQFYQPAEEIGLDILQPTVGGEEIGEKFLVDAVMHRPVDLQATPFLVLEVSKGKDRSYSYLPIREKKVSEQAILRFGEGKYTIRLLKPDLLMTPTNQLHLLPLAEWIIESKQNPDKRDLLPQQGIESDHAEIIKLATMITKHAKSSREKAYRIYEYVATHIAYDMQKASAPIFDWRSSAIQTLQDQKATCQGYTYLAVALLRASQISARVVEGTVVGVPHAWGEVWLDGKWVPFDATWGAGYLTQSGIFHADYKKEYFDPSETSFRDHQRLRVVY